jgi:choline dehydrogenase
VGDESYMFDRMLPYFERSICFTPPNAELRFANSSQPYNASVMGDC